MFPTEWLFSVLRQNTFFRSSNYRAHSFPKQGGHHNYTADLVTGPEVDKQRNPNSKPPNKTPQIFLHKYQLFQKAPYNKNIGRIKQRQVMPCMGNWCLITWKSIRHMHEFLENLSGPVFWKCCLFMSARRKQCFTSNYWKKLRHSE